MTKDLISNQLVRYLEDRGVTHIFGLCGHTNIAVLSAMANTRLRFVNVRHEQIAAHAADGYARVTGRASVLLSHLSPGLTNAATGRPNIMGFPRECGAGRPSLARRRTPS